MKFRASYSVLSLWQAGRWEDALRAYFKLDRYTTRAMGEGKTFHEKWEEETKKTKCLPALFGGRKLKKPHYTELKLEVQLEDWLEFVCVIDCYEQGIIHEYKTGTSSSAQHIDTWQTPSQALALLLCDYNVNEAWVHHYNQHTGEIDHSKKHITHETLVKALEWVKEQSKSMHEYLLENDLYNQLKK